MDRLTKERLGITKNGKEFVICNHEKSDCNDSCKNLLCEWNEKVQMRLHEYEDTGLSPEEINSLNTFDRSQGVKYLKLYQEEQRKHRWIPVSERLPEDTYLSTELVDGWFLITTLYGEMKLVQRKKCVPDGYIWFDGYDSYRAKAWKKEKPYGP